MSAGGSSAELIPDYGWTDAQGEASHAYIGRAVCRALRHAADDAGRPLASLRMFDAGCGNGALLRTLAPLVRERAGCDASEAGIAIARRSNPDARIERLSVYDDLRAVYGAGWDVVVSTEVIEHLYSPRVFVARARELLAPNGTLILSTPYHGYLKNLALAASNRFDAHMTALWDGGHIKFWSYATLRQLLREQGFARFRFIGAGRVPWLWKSMVVSARLDGVAT